MLDGFIPNSRATFMLDLVAVAMVIVLPLLAWSVRQVKVHKNYARHGKVQLILGSVLLVAVLLFEIDMRIHGWRHLAEPSRFYGNWLYPVLIVHLLFAIATTLLWIWTIVGALRGFARPPVPSAYSVKHKNVAIFAVIGMFCTAVTGWAFYVMAFML